MEVLVDRVAGLDVHQKTVVACVRTPGEGRTKRRSEVRTFATFEGQLRAFRDWLKEHGVTHVAMEATGVYWKPVGHVLDGKHRATTTRSGNPWLTSALVEAAWSAARTKGCYLGVRFWRIAKRRGQQRALIAIAHTILIICWHLIKRRNNLRRARHRLPRRPRQARTTTPTPHQSTRKARLQRHPHRRRLTRETAKDRRTKPKQLGAPQRSTYPRNFVTPPCQSRGYG